LFRRFWRHRFFGHRRWNQRFIDRGPPLYPRAGASTHHLLDEYTMPMPHSPSAQEIARRLLAREMPAGGEPAMVAAALQRALARVSANLRDSVGDDGRDALLARALARTEPDYPALKDIRRLNNGAVHLDGVVASADAHGVAPVTAAIEALLAALVDVLARLIGEDMAMRLLDHDLSEPLPDGGTRTP
jgi:hypothetical protein